MLQYIRSRPWRMEIVPAAAFLACLGGVLLLRIRAWQYDQVRFVHTQAFAEIGVVSFFLLCLLSAMWIIEAHCNYVWISSENSKRFNWMMLVLHTDIIVKAWLGLQISSLALSVAIRGGASGVSWRLLLGMLIAGLSVSIWLESTRRLDPDMRRAEPEPPADPMLPGSFCYNDVESSWSIVGSGVVLALGVVPLAIVGHQPPMLIMGVLSTLVLGSLAHRKVTITPELVLLACGPVRKSFRVSEISSCRAIQCEVFRKIDGRWPLCATTGRCLALTMNDGKTHVFGMLRPRYACRLLERVTGGGIGNRLGG